MILAIRLGLSDEIPLEYWEAITIDDESARAAHELHQARMRQARMVAEIPK